MNTHKRLIFSVLIAASIAITAFGQKHRVQHTFSLGKSEFLLDNTPFQIISGEMHPARIPAGYWKNRIQMAKAMGCNTITVSLFWNYYETADGVFDFSTDNRNLAEFIRLVHDEDMWLIVRPGPYAGAGWELGGVPPYLLRIPDIKLRWMDPRYMASAERYIGKLAAELKPGLITNGGPILMLQIENEYGSVGNDSNYLGRIKEIWTANGIDVPYSTGEGPATTLLEAGCLARWGEKLACPDSAGLLREVKSLMDNKKSFNLYVINGGTNFGYTAGANSGGKGYEPDVTSYDYDAPVNEQGRATPKYMALRKLIGSYLPKGKKLPPVPDPIPAIELPGMGLSQFTSVWDNLPEPVNSDQPKPFEALNQDYGFILYTTELADHKKGRLTVTDLHDYATVFLNGEFIGTLDRREGINSIDIPESKAEHPVLEILVEAMGRINFAQDMIDRKGITERVTLDDTTLM
ncbi:MAG: beta-galactosidase, partial [Bacteroidales bacterium]